jgi:hypothetical protein
MPFSVTVFTLFYTTSHLVHHAEKTTMLSIMSISMKRLGFREAFFLKVYLFIELLKILLSMTQKKTL